MHARLIVLLDKQDGETSLDARERANERLLREGFAGQGGGLFASSPSDWFVIGGRWSGQLTELRLDQDKWKAFRAEYEDQRLGWISRKNPEEKQKARAQKLFRQFFPEFKGEPPVSRDPYEVFGFEDDAQVLDEVLFEFLEGLEDYGDIAQGNDLYSGGCFVDLDDPYAGLDSAIVGKKWCIVIDFHS